MPATRISIALAATVAALTLSAASAAAAPPVQCGSVVTKSIKLKKDLTGCLGDGLVIGASDITVDLNGHRVEGTNFNSVGINDSGGHDHIRVVDGTISHFLDGILLVSSRHSKVARNTITNVDGVGINLRNSSDNRVVDNSSSSAHAAMRLQESHRNLVHDNFLTGDGTLFLDHSNLNVVRFNTLTGQGFGVVVNTSSENLFARNTATRTRGFDGFALVSGAGNELRRNTVNDSGDNGIFVGADAESTWLTRNTADGNGLDGIRVLSPSTVLRRNSASDNGRLGINAVDGVTDAGGNRASGNGDPRQCVGVFCSPAG
jgi:parallel beta-helix repeat protein